MKEYNVFNLYVVNVEGYSFICKKLNNSVYEEVFTKEKFENIENVEPLRKYYSLFVIKKYISGNSLMLSNKELLIKYAEINSFNIEKKKSYNNISDTIRSMDEYLEALKKLAEKDPDKAKEIALEDLKRTGIIDRKESCNESIDENQLVMSEIFEAYVDSKKDELNIPIIDAKTLIKNK